MFNPDSSYKNAGPLRGSRTTLLLAVLFFICLIGLHQLFKHPDWPGLELAILGGFILSFAAILYLLQDRNTNMQPRNQLLLESILNNTTSLIYIKDSTGRYILANRRFLNFFGVQEQDVIGHTDEDLHDPESAAHYHNLDAQVLDHGKTLEVEELIRTPEGERNLLLIKFPLLDPAGRILGIGGIAADITVRIHYQQELIRARQAAEEARLLQEQFLANMSHEIRTPMNGIQGMTNLLLETPLTPQQHEFADIIRRSTQNLLVIVNDILDFSKLKTGKLVLEKIDFRLKDVLDNIEGVMGERLRKKGLDFRIRIASSVPELLKGDPYRLNQVLLNLIGNALKFTEKGHILVDVIPQQPQSNTLLFSVTDSGAGISEENLHLIFDSFSQAGIDITRRHGGTGLGLAICSQLLKLQGGGITVHSRPGEGTRFECRIPFEPGSQSTTTPITSNPLDQRSALKNRRILVAEDNEINQKLIEYVLKKAGAEVTIADNGHAAVQYLSKASADQPFEILFMDLQMPLMDGYQATRYIREELKNPIPIIALTATALKGEHLRCLETGMNDYMTKPFEFADLYKCVANLLGKQNLATETTQTAHSSGSNTSPSDKCYDLALLLEMEDDEYLLEMLETFLSNAPGQLKELQIASDCNDFETVYYLSHKLKGSAGMFRAQAFQEILAGIEVRSKDKKSARELVAAAATTYNDLEKQLIPEKEKLQNPIQHENSDS